MIKTIRLTVSIISAALLITSCTPKMRGDSVVKVSSVDYNRSGLPIVEEPLRFDIGVMAQVGDSQIAENVEKGNYMIFDKIEKDTGVGIDWRQIPSGAQTAPKLILMFVSNSYPDAFYGMWNRAADWQLMVNQNFLIPLDPYLEAGLMPNLSAKLEERPELLDGLIMKDGHFYSFPRFVDIPGNIDVYSSLNLNKKWLDALGLEPPENLQEFYEVLVAFKNDDPNGNGENDEIPYSAVFGHQNYGLWALFGSFGLYDNKWTHRMIRDGVVMSPNIQPEYREAVKFFNKLYREGLLDIEFFSQSEEMFNSKIRNDQLGAWIGDCVPVAYGMDYYVHEVSDVTDRVLSILPLKGFEGDVPVWPRYPNISTGGFEITNKCENPEVLVRWVDLFYDDDFGIQQLYGAFGQNLNRNENGELVTTIGMGGTNIETVTFPWGPKALFSPGIIDEMKQTALGKYSTEIYGKYMPYVVEEIYPELDFSKQDSRRVSSIIAETHKLIENKQVAWITGEADIDEEWDWYLKELEKMGIHEEFAIYQKYYDMNKK